MSQCDLEGVDFGLDALWKKNIIANEDKDNLADVIFKYFFLCTTGHAKRNDEFDSNNNSHH